MLAVAKKKVKPVARTIRNNGNGTVSITVGKVTTVYKVSELSDVYEGRGFRLEKTDGHEGTDASEKSYWVFVGTNGSTLCDCKGHARAGHCKHSDGMSALIRCHKI